MSYCSRGATISTLQSNNRNDWFARAWSRHDCIQVFLLLTALQINMYQRSYPKESPKAEIWLINCALQNYVHQKYYCDKEVHQANTVPVNMCMCFVLNGFFSQRCDSSNRGTAQEEGEREDSSSCNQKYYNFCFLKLFPDCIVSIIKTSRIWINVTTHCGE